MFCIKIQNWRVLWLGAQRLIRGDDFSPLVLLLSARVFSCFDASYPHKENHASRTSTLSTSGKTTTASTSFGSREGPASLQIVSFAPPRCQRCDRAATGKCCHGEECPLGKRRRSKTCCFVEVERTAAPRCGSSCDSESIWPR